jgi:hypothetical protein
MRGLKQLRCAQTVCSGHAFAQNLRLSRTRQRVRSHRLEAIFSELALAI